MMRMMAVMRPVVLVMATGGE